MKNGYDNSNLINMRKKETKMYDKDECCPKSCEYKERNGDRPEPENYFMLRLTPKLAATSSKEFTVLVSRSRLNEALELVSKEFDVIIK